jgi:type I restriction enzyme S subunit
MSGLPESWAEASIADVITPFASVDPTKTPKQTFRYVDIGSIDNKTQMVSNPKSFLGRDAPSRARRIIRTGDTLFSTVRTYLKNIALVPEELNGELTSTGIAVLRPNGAVDAGYLFRWACSDDFVGTLSSAQDGTMYPAVSDRDVAVASIPLPPLPEQRRIVAKIDSLTGKSKRARDHLDHTPRLVEKYKQAVLAAAFRGDLTREWRVENKVAYDYEEVEISTLSRVVTGSTPPTKGKARFFGGSIAFVKPTDLDAGYHVAEVRETLTDEGAAVSRKVPEGSTLVTCIGATIGKTGFARVPCCTNQQINALVPDRKKVVAEWLYWMVISPDFRQSILDNSSATTLPIINKGRFQHLLLPRVPRAEQHEMVRVIEIAMDWIDRLASEATSARRLIDRLDQAVLAKAFRGELVPQDPADEPASVLLKRISAERGAASKAGRGRRIAG